MKYVSDDIERIATAVERLATVAERIANALDEPLHVLPSALADLIGYVRSAQQR